MQPHYPDYKLLLVDDIDTNLFLLRAILGKDGFQIETAASGTEALVKAKSSSPDLILLDIMMPDIDGYEVATCLRQDPATESIPILFLTALDDSQSIIRGFEVGGADFITKPFNRQELQMRIRHQISLIHARHIINRQNLELQETIRGRDRMYAVIAHDLRSPISSIKMILNLLNYTLDEKSIGNEKADLLRTANRTTENLFGLLDNLLKWTNSQIGHLQVVPQEFDLTTVVNGQIEAIRSGASLKNIQIESFASEAVYVKADIDMIGTVIRNLLSNAIKFTPEGGEVKFYIGKTCETIFCEVRDNGIGIPLENQEKLFTPHEIVVTWGTNKEEGSGLGLMLCKDFVDKNGGTFWFSSELGTGSSFFFELPRASQHE